MFFLLFDVSDITLGIVLLVFIPLSFIAFYVNYNVLSVKNGKVKIPAADQIRTFMDVITLNPLTGIWRFRTYDAKNIESVLNGYTKEKNGQNGRTWNVVISGTHNGNSFSQRIDCSNKQTRDEIRNVLNKTTKGNIGQEWI